MRRKKITPDHLLQDYRRLKRSLGRRPTCLEFAKHHHSVSLLSNAFGSPGWKRLLEAAGDQPERRGPLTSERVVKEYLALKAELGRRPTSMEYAKRHHSMGMLRYVFGKAGWNNLLKAAGERPKLASFVTRADLLRDYLALKKKLGRQPQLAEYQRESYGIGIITKKFGRPAWRALMAAAGDEPAVGFNIPAKHLVEDFLNLQEKLGRRPKLLEYTYQCHTPKVLDRVFGKPGWRMLIKAVGKKAKPKNILTAEHLIQDYCDTRAALGHDPSETEFHARNHHTIKVMVRIFGTPGWSNLKKAALKTLRR